MKNRFFFEGRTRGFLLFTLSMVCAITIPAFAPVWGDEEEIPLVLAPISTEESLPSPMSEESPIPSDPSEKGSPFALSPTEEKPSSSEKDSEKSLPPDNSEWKRYEFLEERMAVPVRLIFYADSEEKAEAAQEAVYQRFDELNRMMSDYDPESELVRACRESGENLQPVEISGDLFNVLSLARRVHRVTGGAFDISVSPVVKLWRRSRSFHQLPPERYLAEAKKLVGQGNWELSGPAIGERIRRGVIGEMTSPPTLRVLQKNVRLDLGGIAKGYAIDEGIRLLRKMGINSALIDAGGDLRVGDAPPDKKGWTIGIASLAEDAGAAFYLVVENQAVATSGDTFQFIEIDGVRYSHLIDPRTCEPVTRRTVASVLAPNAATADALASALCVLDPKEGVRLAESLKGVETIIFREKKEGKNGGNEEGKEGLDGSEIFATGRFEEIRDRLVSGDPSVTDSP